MKRFRSPLQRLLRVKEQAERLKQLGVARARTDVDAATSQLSIAEVAEQSHLRDLTVRLNQLGASMTVLQSAGQYRERQVQAAEALERHALFQSLFEESLCEHREARQQREMVERVLTHQQEQHRRHAMRAAIVELQERSLRRTPDPNREPSVEGPHA
ncbi:MAG: hypothetical protein KDA86_18765 [Planctomycetaceae bacterium]|nr:hypothetical protein [Planctomycetaceae bacterium]MCA9108408.1 hypothetical protein [Planctomycetaceae bacterium]